MKQQWFQRTGLLLRVNARQNRVKLTAWLAALVIGVLVIAASFSQIYQTPAALAEIAKTLKTDAMVALFGPVATPVRQTVAAAFAMEMPVFTALILIVMNYQLAVGSAREDEDAGLLELVRAHGVGRLAPLLATALLLTGLNALIGGLLGSGLQLIDMPGATTGGNWVLALGLASTGWAFGMLSLVCAQLASSARGSLMLSYALLGGMYIGRMLTDLQNPRLTWWIPFGWVEKLGAYQAENWLPVGNYGLFGLLALGVALGLNARRDLGAGWLPPRLGRRRASVYLRGPVSLVGRLHRGSLVAWLLASLVLGGAYASVFNTIGDLAQSNPMIKQVLGTAGLAAANRVIVKNFLAILAIVLVVLAAIPALQIMLQLVSDEQKGYLHQLYATATGRWHVWASYTGWAVLTGSLVYLAGLLGMYLVGVQSMTDPLHWSTYWHIFTAYVPAMLVMIAVASLLTGWLPHWRALSWAWLAYAFFSMYLGKLIDLPRWAQRLTPFGFVDKVPVKAVNWATNGWFFGLTVLILMLAAVGYRRRDLAQ